MIEESGIVVDIREDTAWVETRRRTTCDKCSANKGCGSAVLAKVLGNRRSVVQVINSADVRIGDEVVLGLQEASLVRGSIAVYGVPLGAMFGTALLGETLANNLGIMAHEPVVIASGLIGLIAGFHWVYRFGKKIRRDSRYQPVILRQVTAGQQYEETRMLI